MQWTSEAIIIKQEQFSDDKIMCHLLSSTHGLYKGLISINKKTRNQIQVGNIVQATWRARLEEHLGFFYCELLKPLSMTILSNQLKLTSVLSLCSILSASLPPRTVEAKIYDETISYLLILKDHKDWLIEYIKLELLLLQEMGYGLNLDSCSITGKKEDIYYISPKTGNAVSKEIGKEYHNKLFIIPNFLLKNSQISANKEDILNSLRITGYFINQRLFKIHSQNFPQIRNRFEEIVNSLYA